MWCRRALIKENAHRWLAGGGDSGLRAAKPSTATICSRVTPNHSMISSILAPDSRFSKNGGTRHASVFKHPRAAALAGDAFHGGTF
jgi:hypothetical protein